MCSARARACEDRKEVAVVDLATGTLLHSVATAPAQSHAVVLTRDEWRAYTANFSAGTVTILDLKTRSVVKQISTGPGTEASASRPTTKRYT